MAFTTPCCASGPDPDPAHLRRWLGVGDGNSRAAQGSWARALRAWLLALLALCLSTAASASSPVQLLRDAEGLSLSARLNPELPDELQAVLLRGVPLHFVWQAQVRRPRWYWTAEYLVSVQRVVRVAYQPLTRRWRVSVSSGPLYEVSTGTALHQNLDSFADALAAATSVSRWRLLAADELPKGAALRVEFEFRLDDGLLPRPFQLLAPQNEGWSVLHRQTLRLPAGSD